MPNKFISTKMKIFLSVLLLLCIVFYASGCIVLAQSGYKLSDYANELNINPHSFKFGFNFNSYSTSKDYTLDSNIQEIDFNLNSQDIEVCSYSGDTLNITIKSNNSQNNELSLSQNDGKLIFSTNYSLPSNSTIIVSVPSNFSNTSNLKFTTSSGDITAHNLNCNLLNLSVGSGDINLSDCMVSYLYLNNSSGDINFNAITTSTESKLICTSGDIIGTGSLGTLTSTTSSGDINLNLSNITNDSILNTNSGSVNLTMPSNSNYKVNYNTTSGDLFSALNSLSSGDETFKINVNTVSGDLTVN